MTACFRVGIIGLFHGDVTTAMSSKIVESLLENFEAGGSRRAEETAIAGDSVARLPVGRYMHAMYLIDGVAS